MCAVRDVLLRGSMLSSCLLLSTAASAEHVSGWVGGGVGAMLTGEDAPFVNGHKMGMFAVTLPGDRIRLRLLKGSFERTQGIEPGTGDNDLDYEGVDVVVTRTATELPVDLAFGVAKYEEAYHVGYPDEDLGGSEFVHRWGPHAGVLRSWPLGRFFEVWAESDLHFVPYESKQTVLFLNVGFGARF
jgi:hypothetical protein